MGLMAMLENALNKQASNAISAIDATARGDKRESQGKIATIAVVSSPKSLGEQESIRALAFQSKGMTGDSAQELAQYLTIRDRQRDDRRSCAECRSYYAGKCRQRIIPIGGATVYTLHRYGGFVEEDNSW